MYSTVYSYEDRRNIVRLIENLKSHEDYIAIFEILTNDANNSYSSNSAGVYLNLSKTSDATLYEIDKYIKKANKKRALQVDVDEDVIPNSDYSGANRTYKLSNYEKNIIKQRNLKKVLNEDNDYQALTMSAAPQQTNASQQTNVSQQTIAPVTNDVEINTNDNKTRAPKKSRASSSKSRASSSKSRASSTKSGTSSSKSGTSSRSTKSPITSSSKSRKSSSKPNTKSTKKNALISNCEKN